MLINSAKDLDVYKKAYHLAMSIFALTKSFPPEERFALTSQIRRSSRSICLNLREAWAKRLYQAHFVSKLTDCDGENNETDSSLDFARDCGYITPQQHHDLATECQQIGRMLGRMIETPDPFLRKSHIPGASSQRPAAMGQRAEIGNQKTEARDQRSDFRPPASALRPPTSDL